MDSTDLKSVGPGMAEGIYNEIMYALGNWAIQHPGKDPIQVILPRCKHLDLMDWADVSTFVYKFSGFSRIPETFNGLRVFVYDGDDIAFS